MTKVNTVDLSNKVFIPHTYGNLCVQYNGKQFAVLKDNVEFPISHADLSHELRGISKDDLDKILSVSSLSLNKIGKDYALRVNPKQLGGGFLTAIATTAAFGLGGVVCVIAGATTMAVAPVVGAAPGAAIMSVGVGLWGAMLPAGAVAAATPTP